MSEEVIKDKNGYVIAKFETKGTNTIMYDNTIMYNIIDLI